MGHGVAMPVPLHRPPVRLATRPSGPGRHRLAHHRLARGRRERSASRSLIAVTALAGAIVAPLPPVSGSAGTRTLSMAMPLLAPVPVPPLPGMPAAGAPSAPDVPVTPATVRDMLLANPDGSLVRWDPCQPVRYKVNLAGAPVGALATVRTAAAEVEAATGLDLVYGGTTAALPTGQWGSTGDRSGRWPPLTIAWPAASGRHSSTLLPRGVVGEGGWHESTLHSRDGRLRITTGFVLLRRGHLGAGLLTRALMHELGHAVGLAHSGSTADVMYPTLVAKGTDWGPDDLVALGQVGRQASDSC